MVKLVRSSKLVVLVVAALGSFGCAATRAEDAAPRLVPTTHVDRVEVLLDRQPERPFVVMEELSSKTANNPASIEAMRRRAEEAGYDGIYWIDCTSACSGMCTAKGYVYADGAGAPASSAKTARGIGSTLR